MTTTSSGAREHSRWKFAVFVDLDIPFITLQAPKWVNEVVQTYATPVRSIKKEDGGQNSRRSHLCPRFFKKLVFCRKNFVVKVIMDSKNDGVLSFSF